MQRGGNRRRNIPNRAPTFDINDVQLKKMSFKQDREGLNQLFRAANILQRDEPFGWYLGYGPLSMKAIYNGQLVGAVLVDERKNPDGIGKFIYIAAIATHIDFRNKQIGAKMINYVKDMAKPKRKTHTQIRLHVETANVRAQAFYANHHQFQVGRPVPNHYGNGNHAIEYFFNC